MRSALLILAIILSGCTSPTVFINDIPIHADVAATPQERSQGLMFREKLCGNCGMLFIFDTEDTHTFWMKNTLIPLDIIFISKDLIVVDLIEAAPCSTGQCQAYTPSAPAFYALEVNQGFSAQHQINTGDHVTLQAI